MVTLPDPSAASRLARDFAGINSSRNSLSEFFCELKCSFLTSEACNQIKEEVR